MATAVLLFRVCVSDEIYSVWWKPCKLNVTIVVSRLSISSPSHVFPLSPRREWEQQRSLQDAFDQLQAEAKFDADQSRQQLEEKRQEVTAQQAQITVSQLFFKPTKPCLSVKDIQNMSLICIKLQLNVWGFCVITFSWWICCLHCRNWQTLCSLKENTPVIWPPSWKRIKRALSSELYKGLFSICGWWDIVEVYLKCYVDIFDLFLPRELVQTMEQNAVLRKQVSDLTTQSQQRVCFSSLVFSVYMVAIIVP